MGARTSSTTELLPWLIITCSIILSLFICCGLCAVARPIIEHDCDEEPDPAVVGDDFHKQWLRECEKLDKLTLRRRDTRRRDVGMASGLVNVQQEQLVGLMGSDSFSY